MEGKLNIYYIYIKSVFKNIYWTRYLLNISKMDKTRRFWKTSQAFCRLPKLPSGDWRREVMGRQNDDC